MSDEPDKIDWSEYARRGPAAASDDDDEPINWEAEAAMRPVLRWMLDHGLPLTREVWLGMLGILGRSSQSGVGAQVKRGEGHGTPIR
jgi:hypothetical protein